MAFLIIKNSIYEFFSKFPKYVPAMLLFIVSFLMLGTFEGASVIKFIVATVLTVFSLIFWFAAYLNRRYFDIFSKNFIPFIVIIIINQIITELLSFLGGFLAGHLFSDPSGTFARAVDFGWDMFSIIITIPLQFGIFKIYKKELSVAEGFNEILCFFKNNFWKKALFYIRLSLAGWVYLIPAMLVFVVLSGLSIAFTSDVFAAINYILMFPIVIVVASVYEIALCEYYEECELY